MEQFFDIFSRAETFRIAQKRPFILVSYAQSVNGSIAAANREPIHLSGQESLLLTHRLRSLCDTILVGIGTILSDDPQLTTRLVKGPNPQPIVLDSRLRMPRNARLLEDPGRSAWIVCDQKTRDSKIEQFQTSGATILPCATDGNGKIQMIALMELLAEREINSVMVEGGARIIRSFISSRLVDQFIITISPKLLKGLPVLEENFEYVSLADVSYQQLGDDIILSAKPIW